MKVLNLTLLIATYVLISFKSFASNNNIGLNSYCGVKDDRLINQNLIPQKLNISINKSKRWFKNSVSILISRETNILEKNKKKFNSKISFNIKNTSCVLKAKVRQAGDWKDHVVYETKNGESYFIQSLNVELADDHINGIRNFKLFSPRSRNIDGEVFITNLLRQIGYLAPRTYAVNVTVNDQKEIKMLMQENSDKELLESNSRREGPIFEGDERFIWLTNNLSSKLDKESNRSRVIWREDLALSRMTNSEIIQKSQNLNEVSIRALTDLNKYFLQHAFKQNVKVGGYFLNNEIIAKNFKNKEMLDAFEALMLSINNDHSLRPHNRIFYWNVFENFFEPIYYDGIISFSKNNIIDVPLNKKKGFKKAKMLIDQVDIHQLLNDIKKSNLNYTYDEVIKILEIIKLNLNNVKYIKDDESSNIKLYLETYLKKISEFNLNEKNKNKIFLAFYNLIDKQFYLCKNLLSTDCNIINLNLDQRKKLSRGRLMINKNFVQFLGNIKIDRNELTFINNGYKTNTVKVSNFIIEHSDGIIISYNETSKILEFKKNINGAFAIIKYGNLKDVKIIFKNVSDINDNNNIDISENHMNLTGCLTLYKSKIENIEIEISGADCEDSVNFINVEGSINKIDISNSESDAIDFDFSKITLNQIKVNNAGNDCIDFSYGNYEVKNLIADNCGDKAVSVGEKSKIKLDNLNIKNSNFAVAVKDESTAKIQNLVSFNNKHCLAVYRKKKEFSGGIISIVNNNCKKNLNIKDSGSEIYYESY